MLFHIKKKILKNQTQTEKFYTHIVVEITQKRHTAEWRPTNEGKNHNLQLHHWLELIRVVEHG